MTNTDLLKKKMKDNSLTIKMLAKQIGLSITGLFNKIHGKREFTVSEMLAICDSLSLTYDEREKIFFATL